MVITADELASAQKQYLDGLEEEKINKINKKTAEVLEAKTNAERTTIKSKSKQNILLKDWKRILKHVLVITSSKDYMSSFSTKGDIMNMLLEVKWEYIF